jgi:hypothetical protein
MTWTPPASPPPWPDGTSKAFNDKLVKKLLEVAEASDRKINEAGLEGTVLAHNLRRAQSSGVTLCGCRVFLDKSDERFWFAREHLQRMAEQRNANLGGIQQHMRIDDQEELDADVIYVKRIEVVKEVPVIREEEAKPPSKPAVNEAAADWRKGFVAGAIYACVLVAILGTAALWILRTHGVLRPEQPVSQPSDSLARPLESSAPDLAEDDTHGD